MKQDFPVHSLTRAVDGPVGEDDRTAGIFRHFGIAISTVAVKGVGIEYVVITSQTQKVRLVVR